MVAAVVVRLALSLAAGSAMELVRSDGVLAVAALLTRWFGCRQG